MRSVRVEFTDLLTFKTDPLQSDWSIMKQRYSAQYAIQIRFIKLNSIWFA